MKVGRVAEYLENLNLQLNHRDPYLQEDQPATYSGLRRVRFTKAQAEATQISQR